MPGLCPEPVLDRSARGHRKLGARCQKRLDTSPSAGRTDNHGARGTRTRGPNVSPGGNRSITGHDGGFLSWGCRSNTGLLSGGADPSGGAAMGRASPGDVCPGSSKRLSGVFRAWHAATAGRMEPDQSGGGPRSRGYLPVPGNTGNDADGQLAPGMAIQPASDPRAPNP